MNILTDIRLLSRGGTSGIEEYTRNLLGEILKIDNSNHYSFFYNGLRKKAPFDEEVVDWGVPNKLLDFSSKFLSWPKVDNFIEADLIFSPHFNILKTKKTPRVITFHDLSFMHHPQFFSWKQKFWHWLQDIKTQAQEAAKIIAVSEFTKSDLINLLKIPPEKISVVYSGISEEFCPLKDQSNASTGSANILPERSRRRPYILYLGTLEPRKNVPAIIRAFNILKTDPYFKDWQLVLAGRPGWLYENVLREAGRSPFRADIIFKGSVKAEERVLLYNLAEAFIYPSFFEGFGFPPLEAQASGCPVIVSDRTSLPEIMGNSALLVNSWKPADIAESVRVVAQDQQLKSRLIVSGIENSRRFNWKAAAIKTLEVFNNVR